MDVARLTSSEIVALESFFKEHFNGQIWRLGIYERGVTDMIEASEGVAEKIKRLLSGIKKSHLIVCLGTEVGNLGEELVERYGCSVDVFCDEARISEKDFAKITPTSFPKKLNFRRGTLTALPYDWNSVDMVVSTEALSLSTDKERLINQISYILKPKGRFLLTTLLYPAAADEKAEHAPLLSLEEYERMASKADLERVITRNMTPQLLQHYQNLNTFLADKETVAKQQLGSNGLAKLQSWLSERTQQLQANELDWGLLQFQKRNL